MTDTTYKVQGITIDRFVDGEKMADDTNLNDTFLQDAFLTQSGLAAYYGTMLARAEHQTTHIKLRRDAMIAEISQRMRTQFEDAKPKLTEGSLEEKLSLDPKVKAWRAVVAECCLIEGELKATYEAIKHRRDMIVQLGANNREDLKGTLRMSGAMTGTPAASAQRQKIKDAMMKKARPST